MSGCGLLSGISLLSHAGLARVPEFLYGPHSRCAASGVKLERISDPVEIKGDEMTNTSESERSLSLLLTLREIFEHQNVSVVLAECLELYFSDADIASVREEYCH